jgi:predicted  nucleic acid-binding Zn-ribbon protein
MRTMNTYALSASLALVALTGLGLSAPSCGGTQALQAQVDSLTARQGEMQGQLQRLGAQLSRMDADMRDAKLLSEQVGKTVIAHKEALERIQAAMAQNAEKPQKAKKPSKAPKKKKKKKA